jgi:hypothetical protein
LGDVLGEDLADKNESFGLRAGQSFRVEGSKGQASPMLFIASRLSPRICVEKVNPGMM